MKELVPLLEKLADKLGVTSAHLWEVLIKQAKISAITDLVWFMFYIPFFIIGTWVVIKKWDKWYGACSYEAQVPFVIFISTLALVAVILLIVTICGIPNIISGFFNPEYWALDKIIYSIKNKE